MPFMALECARVEYDAGPVFNHWTHSLMPSPLCICPVGIPMLVKLSYKILT